MPNFERQIIGEIPLHEAAAFFVSMKAPLELSKTASPVQAMFNRLRSGDMPEGKAGRFQSPVLQKEAAGLTQAKGLQRMGQLFTGSRATALGEQAAHQQKSITRAGRAGQYAMQGGITNNIANVDPMTHVNVARHQQSAQRGLDRTQRALGRENRAVALTRGGTALGGLGLAASAMPDKQAAAIPRPTKKKEAGVEGAAIQEAVEQAAQAPGFAQQVASKLSKIAPLLADDAAVFGARLYNRDKEASARMLKAALRMKVAFVGETNPNMESGQPSPAAGNVEDPGAAEQITAPAQDPVAAQPTRQETVPVNYMGAELVGQAAQALTETGFLRERLRASTEQNNALQQQLQQMQEQLAGLQEQSQSAGDQVMQATNEAVGASERALQHSMAAANMKMGIQKMREAMMELASQDPEQMGNLAQEQQMQEQQMAMDPQASGGEQPPGGASEPAAQPGPGAPPGGGSDPSGGAPGEGKPKGGTSVSIKTGGVMSNGMLPGAMAGAGLAALQGYKRQGSLPEAQQEVDDLETQQEQEGGSFAKALDLAKAKRRLADTELQAKHPVRANVQNVLGGAAGGAIAGGALKRLHGTWRA